MGEDNKSWFFKFKYKQKRASLRFCALEILENPDEHKEMNAIKLYVLLKFFPLSSQVYWKEEVCSDDQFLCYARNELIL